MAKKDFDKNVSSNPKPDKKKREATALSVPEYFLEHIKMTSFGKFANFIVGPFGSGMNVVYGPNEAGRCHVYGD